jgi:hypothetical protein
MKITVVFFYLCLIKCFSSAGKSFERERNVFFVVFVSRHTRCRQRCVFLTPVFAKRSFVVAFTTLAHRSTAFCHIVPTQAERQQRECARERELSLSHSPVCCYYQVAIFQKKVLARHRFVYNVRALAPERGESGLSRHASGRRKTSMSLSLLLLRRNKESDKRKKFYSFSNASCRDKSRQRCAICVQNPDDSLRSAIHIVFRVSLRSSSFTEPRHPPNQIILFL